MKSEFGSSPVSGSIDGKALALTISVDAGGHSFELKLTGTVEGDGMSGQVESPFGEASKFKASKAPKAKER
jgi:hypothetical protein